MILFSVRRYDTVFNINFYYEFVIQFIFYCHQFKKRTGILRQLLLNNILFKLLNLNKFKMFYEKNDTNFLFKKKYFYVNFLQV